MSCSKSEKTQIIFPKEDFDFQIVDSTDSITICWDPPEKDTAYYYELGYWTPKQTQWTPTPANWKIINDSIPAVGSPKFTVYRKDLDSKDSIFYFAVRTVTKDGMKSKFHSSADSTALPVCWFVLWKTKR